MAQSKDKESAKGHQFKKEDKGIKWDRSCTDIFCCLIFLAFIVSMFAITSIAMSQGDPARMLTPFDSAGNLCGEVGSDFEEYPYKHFTNLQEAAQGNVLDMYYAVCVKECPLSGKTSDCKTNKDVTSCASLIYDTEQLYGYCMPSRESAEKILTKIEEELNNESNFGKYILDLQNCWQGLAVMAFATIVISVIYVFLLKWITKPLLYISMILILVGFILLGGFAWMHKDEYKPESDNYMYSQYGAIAAWVVAFAYLICMCCCYKNISLGASIMECASEFVSQNIRIVILPLIAYVLSMIFMVYWVITAIYLFSVGKPKFEEKSFIANIERKQEFEYLGWYFLFGLFWAIAFIICTQQFMIGALSCMWYYSGQGQEMSDQPGEVSVFLSFKWASWYHCGSIAFGSFIIALVTFIRVVFEYLNKKYEAMGNKDNMVYKAVSCCMRCVLWCLDKYVKFITKNAYIQIALHSESFCTSAWNSFWLILRHAGRFGAAEMIGFIMMILGKATIMGSSAWITMVYIKFAYPHVQQPIVPAAIIAAVGYLVGSLFLSVFSFSCTAILHSFLLDEDTGGSTLTPDSLKNFINFNDEKNADKPEQKEDEGKE